MCYIGYVCCPILFNLFNKIFLDYEIILQCIVEYNISYNDGIGYGLHHAPYQKHYASHECVGLLYIVTATISS